MKKNTKAKLVRIFFGESDHHHGVPLHQALLAFCRKNHVAGATVIRGHSGFGKSSAVHTADILRLSSDLPVVVEIVDTEKNMAKIRDQLVAMVPEGLVTEENVTILSYEGKKKKR